MDKKTKYDYGYSDEIKDTFFLYNTTNKKGSFQLLKKKNDWYWYFLLSGSGGNRLKYICKTHEGKVNGLTSFQYCLEILKEKLENDFQPKNQSSMRIGRLIDEYLSQLLKENEDTNGRMYETIQSLKNADGLVVGSAICKEISKSIEKRQNAVTNVTNMVKKLKNKIL